MSRPEVMVVGAGPAGLSAALELAEKGCQVTVITPEEKTGYRFGYLFASGRSSPANF